jgi:hypothetical protein
MRRLGWFKLAARLLERKSRAGHNAEEGRPRKSPLLFPYATHCFVFLVPYIVGRSAGLPGPTKQSLRAAAAAVPSPHYPRCLARPSRFGLPGFGLLEGRGARVLLSLSGSRDRRQSRGPVMRVAAIKLHRGTVTADDHPVTVILDFVDPIGADRRF